MALSDLFGINSTAGTSDLDSALAALQAVNVPNLAQLTLPELKKYVAAGVLTPQQYQAISSDPQAYQQAAQAAQDNTGKTAQSAALQQLGNISQAGGSTPINQANLTNNINQTNQAMQASRQGIMEKAQQQGTTGGGLQLIQQLMNEQNNSQNANIGAINAGASNAQLGLNALAQQGQLGGQMQGQANTQAQAAGEAAQQVAEYNSQLQSAANQYNTQNANTAQAANLTNAQNIGNQNTSDANMRTQYNAALPQQLYQDQMQKAQGIAGAYGNQGQLAQQQAGQQNAFTGSLIGAGATVLGGMYGGPMGAAAGAAAGKAITGGAQGPGAVNTTGYKPVDYGQQSGYSMGGEVNGQCYAEGGEVHDHQLCMQAGGGVPGDSEMPGQDAPENDTVDAKLSPHEIVLPTSVAQAPNAPQAASQFVGAIKGGGLPPPTVGSFQEALKILEANGLDLRLTAKGA